MRKKHFTSKTYLKVLIVVGLLAVVGGGAGTFATFNATVTNAGNTFATGTLVLSNTVNTAEACLSTGTFTDTNLASCTQIFNATISAPGDIAGANVTLKNVGSLPATVLNLQASACAPGNNSSETYHGSGNLCTELNFYVQEWSNSVRTMAYKCWYGSTDDGTTCDPAFGATSQLLSGFGAGVHDISVGPSLASPALTAGGTRWFTVAVQLPQSADNTYQGRQAQLDLTWEEIQ
jgi:hypothetical protein